MEKKPKYNPQTHHRRSIRLQGYDYSQAGLYFVTIGCQNRICWFGRIENGEMRLNEYGKIAYNEWVRTPELRPNVELGEFVIMPNHMHGIVRLLGRGELHSPEKDRNELHSPGNDRRGELHSPGNDVSELHSPGNDVSELHSPGNDGGVCDTPLRSPSNNIGAIVRGYKSAVTRQLNLLGFEDKLWQRNYYEHIIRNEQSYQAISEYILNNPSKWSEDKFHL